MIVTCHCTDCRHNTGELGECRKEAVTIDTALGEIGRPGCRDYEEIQEEGSEEP